MCCYFRHTRVKKICLYTIYIVFQKLHFIHIVSVQIVSQCFTETRKLEPLSNTEQGALVARQVDMRLLGLWFKSMTEAPLSRTTSL